MEYFIFINLDVHPFRSSAARGIWMSKDIHCRWRYIFLLDESVLEGRVHFLVWRQKSVVSIEWQDTLRPWTTVSSAFLAHC